MLAPIAIDSQYRRTPYQHYNPMAGLDTGAPGLDMLGQVIGPMLFHGSGQFPGGMTDQNLYDRMQAYRLTALRNEVMESANQQSQEDIYKNLAGLRRLMTDKPMSKQDFADLRAASEMMAGGGGFFAQMLPPAMAEALGFGSQVMADRMMEGSRYAIDPVTGRAGFSAGRFTAMHDEFRKIFKEQDSFYGLTQSETGALYSEMQMAGLMPGISRQQRRAELFRSAKEHGIDLGGITEASQMTPEMVETLQQDSNVQANLRGFDVARVKGTLKDYAGAVNAIREMFGDAGRTDAPVPELLNGLNQLTAGALTQLNPADVENMARTTNQLAKATSLGLEGAMMLTEAGMQQAMAMGLPPIMAADAVQGALAFRGAHQNLGLGANPAWGQSGQNEQMLQDLNLRLAAAASPAANQAGAAFRLNRAVNFDPNSAAGRYLTAIRQGKTQFMYNGEMTGIDMEVGAFQQMLLESSDQLDAATVSQFMDQRFMNLEQIQNEGVADVVRNTQATDWTRGFNTSGQWAIASQMSEMAAAAGIGAAEQGRLSEELVTAMMTRAASDDGTSAGLFNMTDEQRSDHKLRRDVMKQAAFDQLQEQAAAGDVAAGRLLAEMKAADPEQLNLMLDSLYGTAEEFQQINKNIYGGGNLQDFLDQNDPQVREAIAANMAAATAKGQIASALSPLRGGGVLHNAMDAIANAEAGDDLADIARKAIGGENIDEIMAKLEAVDPDTGKNLLERSRDKRKRLDELEEELTALEKNENLSPEEKRKERMALQEQIAAEADELGRITKDIDAIGKEFGLVIGAEQGGKAGRDILAEHMASVSGADVSQITDEALQEFYGLKEEGDLENFIKDLDISSRGRREKFEKILEEDATAAEDVRGSFYGMVQGSADALEKGLKITGTLRIEGDTATIEGTAEETAEEPKDAG